MRNKVSKIVITTFICSEGTNFAKDSTACKSKPFVTLPPYTTSPNMACFAAGANEDWQARDRWRNDSNPASKSDWDLRESNKENEITQVYLL